MATGRKGGRVLEVTIEKVKRGGRRMEGSPLVPRRMERRWESSRKEKQGKKNDADYFSSSEARRVVSGSQNFSDDSTKRSRRELHRKRSHSILKGRSSGYI